MMLNNDFDLFFRFLFSVQFDGWFRELGSVRNKACPTGVGAWKSTQTLDRHDCPLIFVASFFGGGTPLEVKSNQEVAIHSMEMLARRNLCILSTFWWKANNRVAARPTVSFNSFAFIVSTRPRSTTEITSEDVIKLARYSTMPTNWMACKCTIKILTEAIISIMYWHCAVCEVYWTVLGIIATSK